MGFKNNEFQQPGRIVLIMTIGLSGGKKIEGKQLDEVQFE